MPVVSYDGQSLILDGRRSWLVSGSIPYAGVPRGQWRDRIRAAANAGLNCIETSLVWALHEPEPGVFRFDHQGDVRHFIEIIAAHGLRCVLRIGPYIGDGWDMGGLPPWLLRADARPPATTPGEPAAPMRLRQANAAFLQAVARYLDAVMPKLHDLQATESPNGPILAVQSEHLWLCHNPKGAEDYMGQVARHLRESGCTVPIITRNNLWQEVSGAMETWHGTAEALGTGRQLRTVQPAAPPLIHIQTSDAPPTWGHVAPDAPPPGTLLRRLAEASAASAMFNIDPFCDSTYFGFSAGRLTGDPASAPDRFVATSNDRHAPVDVAGRPTASYPLVKRLAMFLNSFGDVLSHLKPDDHHTVAATGLSVVHRSGSQGAVVFLLRDEQGPADSELVTPDGRSIPVHLGDEPVAWLMLDANLAGAATLDATNLRPWTFIQRKLLVLFGPPGSRGILGIDGKLQSLTVPTGEQPLILHHDHIHVAVLGTPQLDTAFVGPKGNDLYIGIQGFDAGGQPIAHPDHSHYLVVGLDGSISRRAIDSPRRPATPALGPWSVASLADYAAGTAARFATLPGPRSLEECGATHGYGWYSISINRSRPRRVNLLIPHAADRLHLYLRGKLKAILGPGPGATPLHKPLPLTLHAGSTGLVVLADILGRFAEGLGIEEPRGITGHLLDVKPITLRKPKLASEPRVDPFALSGYVPRCSVESRGPFPRYTFDLTLPAGPSIVVSLRGERPRSVLLINSQPVAIDTADGEDFLRAFDSPLHKGANRLTLALLDRPGANAKPYDPRRRMTVYQVVEKLTADAQWHYAHWRPPEPTAFQPLRGKTAGCPAFFRTTFRVKRTDAPLYLQIAGATKGQLYLNGHNLGRYWVATPTGQKVPPQDRYLLPAPWLHTEKENTLDLFDEHGHPPTRSRLLYG